MPESYSYDIASSGLFAAGGLSGGITSTIAGGSFWDGVCNGLICAGLNHAMHMVVEGVLPDDPPGKGRTTSKSNAQKNIDEAETAVGGTATLIGGAAKMVDGMEKLEEGLTHFGRTLFGINFIRNLGKAYRNEISWRSAFRRIAVGYVEYKVATIPAVGPVLSISISCYDADGGFDNTIYDDLQWDIWWYKMENSHPSTWDELKMKQPLGPY